jgi:hypothetical protein
MLGKTVSSTGKLAAVAVALVPMYWTFAQLTTLKTEDGRVLTDDAKKLLHNPITIFIMAYGTAYAAIGDGPAVTQSLAVISAILYYIFVLHPEIGKKYFDTEK